MRLVHVFARALCRWIWIKVPAHVHIAAFTGIGVCTGGALLFHAGADGFPPPIFMVLAGMQQTAGDTRTPLPFTSGEAMDGHMPVTAVVSPQPDPAAGIYAPFPDRRAARTALLAPVLSALADPILDPSSGDDPGDPEAPSHLAAIQTAAPGGQSAEIPEPGSAMLLLSAMVGLACVTRRSGPRLLFWRSGRP